MNDKDVNNLVGSIRQAGAIRRGGRPAGDKPPPYRAATEQRPGSVLARALGREHREQTRHAEYVRHRAWEDEQQRAGQEYRALPVA